MSEGPRSNRPLPTVAPGEVREGQRQVIIRCGGTAAFALPHRLILGDESAEVKPTIGRQCAINPVHSGDRPCAPRAGGSITEYFTDRPPASRTFDHRAERSSIARGSWRNGVRKGCTHFHSSVRSKVTRTWSARTRSPGQPAT